MPKDPAMRSSQLLRLHRFAMALSTYVLVTAATILVTRLGLGAMNRVQWTAFIGLGLLGNSIFLTLFYTNANLRLPDPSLTRIQMIYSALWGMVPLYSLPEARPIVLMFYLPAFSFGMLRLTRRQYLGVVAGVMGLYASILVLGYIRGQAGFRIQYEIFLFAIFGILLFWYAFFGGFVSNFRRRLHEQNKKIQRANEKISREMEERRQAQIEKDELIVELRGAIGKVKTLSGLLPICSSCKKIRDDHGYWNQIETYLHAHSEAEFSHSICPDCQEKYYPEYFNSEKNESDT